MDARSLKRSEAAPGRDGQRELLDFGNTPTPHQPEGQRGVRLNRVAHISEILPGVLEAMFAPAIAGAEREARVRR